MRVTQPSVVVHVSWRPAAPSEATARARIVREIEHVSWSLAQMEALLFEAHQVSGADHAWLLPRMELRLPIYDLNLRFRLVATCLERVSWHLEDEKGRRVADVRLP